MGLIAAPILGYLRACLKIQACPPLVLYQGDKAQVPCEANTLIDCKATANATTGSYVLKGLTAAKYYLVVDADKAGSEGGVILQLSGLPSS